MKSIPMPLKSHPSIHAAMRSVDPYDSSLGIQLLGPQDGRCPVRKGEEGWGWGMDLEDLLQRLHELLGRRYVNFRGRGRVCYDIPGDHVVKVPRIEPGLYQNEREVQTYLEYKAEFEKGGYPDGPHYAACRLDYIWALPVVVMEKVTPYPYDKLPLWASYIDCGQVGLNKAGVLVAYDYGS